MNQRNIIFGFLIIILIGVCIFFATKTKDDTSHEVNRPNTLIEKTIDNSGSGLSQDSL